MDEKKTKSPSNEKYLNKQSLTKLIEANHGILDFLVQPFCEFSCEEIDRTIELITGDIPVETLKLDQLALPAKKELVKCFAAVDCQIKSLIISVREVETPDLLQHLKAILEANTNKSLTGFYFPFNQFSDKEIADILSLLSNHKVEHLDIHKRRLSNQGPRHAHGHLIGNISTELIEFIRKHRTTLKSIDLGVVNAAYMGEFSYSYLNDVMKIIQENIPSCSIRMIPDCPLGSEILYFVQCINHLAKTQKKASPEQPVVSIGTSKIKEFKLLESLQLLPTVLNTIVLDFLKDKPSKVPYHTYDPLLASLNDPVLFLKQVHLRQDFQEDFRNGNWIWMAECFRQLMDKLCEYRDEDGLIATFQYLLEKDNVIYGSLPPISRSTFFQMFKQQDRWTGIADSIHRGLDYLPPINPLFEISQPVYLLSDDKLKQPMVHLVLDDMQMGLGAMIITRMADNLGKFCTLYDKNNKPCKIDEEAQKVDERYPYSKTAVFLSINLSDYRELYAEFNLESYALPKPAAAISLDQEAKPSVRRG